MPPAIKEFARRLREDAIIRVSGFEAAYRGVTVLEDVNFSIREGEVVVLLGGSGSGKSTLMKHMIGLLPPAAGEIFIDGMELSKAEGPERLDILKRIGVMYQSGALFGSMTLRENIRLPLEEFTNLPEAAMDLIALMKLDLVDLRMAAEKMPDELSGGMKKRAGIARALALEPQILFLDEPSAGLDPITSAELDQLILRLARELHMTVVVVSHELASIFTIADRVLFLDKRKKTITAEGPPEELRRSHPDPYVRDFLNRQLEEAGG